MMRIVALMVLIGLIALIAFDLKQCSNGHSPLSDHRPVAHADLSSIVVLRNGSVLTAPKGTVGRDMMDWLADPNRSDRYFELGGKEFEGRVVEPTIESKVRVKRLIEMLQSNQDVTVLAIGFTAATGDPAADLQLSKARAVWLVQALRDGGVSPSRLSAEGRGGNDPIGSNSDPAGRARNERVALLLHTRSRN